MLRYTFPTKAFPLVTNLIERKLFAEHYQVVDDAGRLDAHINPILGIFITNQDNDTVTIDLYGIAQASMAMMLEALSAEFQAG